MRVNQFSSPPNDQCTSCPGIFSFFPPHQAFNELVLCNQFLGPRFSGLGVAISFSIAVGTTVVVMAVVFQGDSPFEATVFGDK